ncbi:MAG: methylmalonyl Co-A mutase-associated GTPase MeaB [Candidatus Aminicenantes bacterium]
MDIAEEIFRGNPRAVARAISLIENNHDRSRDVMKRIFPHTGNSLILGITGSPGSGKSTLVDQMIERLLESGRKIGIIAVDPSSPFTGGAILGDRIRMMRHSIDDNIFIRSMATRGHLGGLAKATGEAISVLEASGKDVIIVETVGVGQDEVEVVKLADMILVILTPGAGDDIQAFKAGIMEIGDIFVLNKADSPDADKTERQLRAMLELGLDQEAIPPVIKTVATTGKNVGRLIEEIEKIHSSRDEPLRAERKKRLIFWMLKDLIREKTYELIKKEIDKKELGKYVNEIYDRKIDPYTLADRLMNKIKGSRNDKKP